MTVCAVYAPRRVAVPAEASMPLPWPTVRNVRIGKGHFRLIRMPRRRACSDETLQSALESCAGDVSLAAAKLGIGRATAYRRLRAISIKTRGAREEEMRDERRLLIGGYSLTKAQQIATKKLISAQEEWLLSYKWTKNHLGWKHPRFEYAVTIRDAISMTNQDPTLGWP